MVEAGKEKDKPKPRPKSSNLKRKNPDEKIKIDLKLPNSNDVSKKVAKIDSDESIRKVFQVPKTLVKKETFSVDEVKEKLSSIEAKVFQDPSNADLVEEMKSQLEALESLIAKQKSKVITSGNLIDIPIKTNSESDDDDVRSEDTWVLKDIVVKTMAKKLGSQYYKKKGYNRTFLFANLQGTLLNIYTFQLESLMFYLTTILLLS
jgi:hypothetical protein